MKITILLGATLLYTTAVWVSAPKTITRQNDRIAARIAARFDARSGVLVRLVNQQTRWTVMNRSVLGQSLELLMPQTGDETK